MKGQVVTMDGPFTSDDEVKFNNSVKAFEDATGIDIKYSGSKEFEASISAKLQSGAVTDIVDFPQPGLAGTFIKQGKTIPADKLVPMDWLKKNYAQSWLDMSMATGADGKPIVGGIWQRFNAKDQVWYPKKAFDAAGYKVPTTWDEMMNSTEKYEADLKLRW
jgi:alpha-glucoside transport system substrate-binding protein